MPRKKNTGPMLFCEWVIGGPLPGARRAMKPKPAPPKAPPPKAPSPPRDVIRVEVTTDDEKEEDTLTITFPRSGKAAASSAAAVAEQAAEAVVKKVRFEDDKKGTKKSAMKQPKSEDSDSSTTLAESSSDGESSSDAKDETTKKDKNQSSSDESGSDDKPHPTCSCSRCVKKRRKAGKEKANGKKNKDSSESEWEEDSAASSDTDDDKAAKQKESKKKRDKKQENKQQQQQSKKKDKGQGKKKDNSDADDESESAKETTDEEQEAKKSETKADKKKAAAAADKKKQEETKVPNGNAAGKKPSPFSYPEAFPGPHARRPNLIAPIRAQVVQTEDVVETPDDPPPNAFYDAATNVMRVYYGPVYGNHNPQARSLYPRREAAGRPLPVGVPHPSQNPYYYGFQHVPGYEKGGGGGTNGFPQQAPGFPPFVMNAMFQQQQQQQQQQQAQDADAGGQYSKGAFSKNSNAAAPSVSQASDKAGGNNVLPTSKIDEKKTTSPYYTPSKTAAELRDRGQSHHNSPARPATAPAADANTSGWDNNNNNNNNNSNDPPAQDTNTCGDGAAGNDTWNTNGCGGNDWPTDNKTGGSGGAWDNNNNNNNNNNNDANDANNGGSSWDAPAASEPPAETSNVMPGSWESIPVVTATDSAPAWGDPSMAQSTNGAADAW